MCKVMAILLSLMSLGLALGGCTGERLKSTAAFVQQPISSGVTKDGSAWHLNEVQARGRCCQTRLSQPLNETFRVAVTLSGLSMDGFLRWAEARLFST